MWNDIDASGTLSDDNALFLMSTTKLRFLPGSDFNGNPGILSTRLVDGGALSNGSTVDADPNGNGTIYSDSTFALGTTINAINDAPTLNNSVSNNLIPVDEGTAAPSDRDYQSGTPITELVSGISDVDAGASKGIAITAVDTNNGSLVYTIDDGSTWNTVGSVSNSNALLLDSTSSTKIAFEPNPGITGDLTDIFTFRAWDQTSGSAGSKVDTSSNGGTNAFSSTTDTVNITINQLGAVNVLVNNISQALDLLPYGGSNAGKPQNEETNFQLSDNNNTLKLAGNTWAKADNLNYTITPNTVLSFDFESNYPGEVHGIGFSNNNNITSGLNYFLYGSQQWPHASVDHSFRTYSEGDGVVSFLLRPGERISGSYQYLTFAMDDDIQMIQIQTQIVYSKI